MKIAFILRHLNLGGVEKNTLRMIKNIDTEKYKIDLVVINAEEGDFSEEIPKTVNIINLNSSRALFCFLKLIDYLKKNRPDFMISAKEYVNVVSFISAKLSRVNTKIIATVRTNLEWEYKENYSFSKKITYFLACKIYEKVDYLVAVSYGVKESVEKFLKVERKDIKVIYNPIVDKQIRLLSNKSVKHKWLNGKYKVIIGSGRLVKQKDFPTLIKAFNILKMDDDDLKLIIIGEGEERKKLGDIIEELNLKNDVDMPGFQINPYSFIKKSDVFVLSSQWEGFGNVLVEAMACGTQVVSTDCFSGPSEILDKGKYGKLVPVGNVNALAKAVKETLTKPLNKEVLKKRARRFSVGRALREYLEIIDE